MDDKKRFIDTEKIAPPKGGGAINGLGEQCSVQPYTGEAVLEIPLEFFGGRSRPDLCLRYKATDGNGIFGMGFSLNLMEISRKTAEHIPTYGQDDCFMYGGEELVRISSRTEGGRRTDIYGFRTEHDFTRLEFICEEEKDWWWEAWDRDGTRHLLGRDARSRVADPLDPSRIFSWMVCESRDSLGNKIVYRYTEEGFPDGIDWGNYREEDGEEAWLMHCRFHYCGRTDGYISYKAGFLREYKQICDRLSLFSRMGGKNTRVGDMLFAYNQDGLVCLLSSVSKKGYRTENGREYHGERLLLELDYTGFEPENSRFVPLDIRNSQPSLMTDLYGEGAKGVLYFTDGSLLYSSPRGDYGFNPPERVEEFPVYRQFLDGGCSLESLNGDGMCDLVVRTGDVNGYFQMEGGKWGSFSPFEAFTNEAWQEDAEYGDMEGDRRSHLVRFGPDRAVYYPNRGLKGVDFPREGSVPEDFPRAARTGRQEVVAFLDLWGDGLSHRVRIRSGSVECWPSQGYGSFGERIEIRDAPVYPEDWVSSRLFFADLDGSGTVDFIYVDQDYALVYLNKGGTGFLKPIRVSLPVSCSEVDQVLFGDINGTGTTCMVLMGSLAGAGSWCLDFSGQIKPYLLKGIANSSGSRTSLAYKSSASLYLEDKRQGREWKLHPPFPIQVLVRMEHKDAFSDSALVTGYRYRDGLFDTRERKFAGFGLVEVREELTGTGYTQGVLKKCWYHVGEDYRDEFVGDGRGQGLLEDDRMDALDRQEAEKRLYGQTWRQETYIPGNTAPQVVSEQNYQVRELARPEDGSRGSYAVFPFQNVTCRYEAAPEDPAVRHEITARIDGYGNVLERYTVYYPRRMPGGEGIPESTFFREQQGRGKVKLEQFSWVNLTDTCRRLGLMTQSGKYDIRIPAWEGVLTWGQLEGLLEKQERSLVSWEKYVYWDGEAKLALPFGQAQSHGLTHHVEQAVIPAAADWMQPFGVLEEELKEVCGYEETEGYWWNKGSVSHYCGREQFYLPWYEELEQWGSRTELVYDKYCLNPVKVLQYALGEEPYETLLETDKETLQICRRVDVNGVVTQTEFTPLGEVASWTVCSAPREGMELPAEGRKTPAEGGKAPAKGKEGPAEGKESPAEGRKAPAKGKEGPAQGGEGFRTEFIYDNEAFIRDGKPTSTVITVTAYENGISRETESRKMICWNGEGKSLETSYLSSEGFWMKEKRTVYNGYGDPWMVYPDYPASTGAYGPSPEGVFPEVTWYDYARRVFRVYTPDTGTDGRTGQYVYTENRYGSWEEYRYDRNHTLPDSPYYKDYKENGQDSPDLRMQDRYKALEKAAPFAGGARLTIRDCRGDRLGELVLGKEPDGREKACVDSVFIHDAWGRLTASTDGRLLPRGKWLLSWVYGLTGEKVLERSADSGARLTLRNGFGEPACTADAAGHRQHRLYDSRLRHRETRVEGLGVTEKILYGKNTPENREARLIDRPCRYYDQAGCEGTDSYSLMGLAREKFRVYCRDYEQMPDWSADPPLEERRFCHSYLYDSAGNVTSHTAPDGRIYRSVYDGGGQVRRIFCEDGEQIRDIISDITYRARGKRATVTYGNGVKTSYSYGISQRPEGVRTADSQGNVQEDLYITFDPEGNLSRVRDMRDKALCRGGEQIEPVWDYEYDEFYRLIRAYGKEAAGHEHDNGNLAAYRESYTYDGSGNLTGICHKGAGDRNYRKDILMSADSNRTERVEVSGKTRSGYECTYDPCGNLQKALGGIEYSWDHEGRLEQAALFKRPGGENDREYYRYNHEGIRERRITVRQIEDGLWETRDLTVNGGYRTDSLRTGGRVKETCCQEIQDGDTMAAAVYCASESGKIEEIRCPVEHHVNCTELETGKDGRVLCREEYYPYGGTALVWKDGKDRYCRYRRYCRKEFDSFTGLYYYGARYYNMGEGRMLSPDRTEYVAEGRHQAQNRYLYCRGNPASRRDPDGHTDHNLVWGIFILAVILMILLIFCPCSSDPVEKIVKGVRSGQTTLSGNRQKGNYGEMEMDLHYKKRGYTRISRDRVTSLDESTHQGIDGTYYKKGGQPEYIIGEAKFGTSRLGKTKDGPQMSDTWVEGSRRLERDVGKAKADEILLQGYGKQLVHVDGQGNTQVHDLDKKGKFK